MSNRLHQLLNSIAFLLVNAISIFYEISTYTWVCFKALLDSIGLLDYSCDKPHL